mgnify:CR=1 FL=1|jgi:hypothetical protein
MDVALVQVQQVPARQVLRDTRGIEIGTIERQRQTGKFIARNRRGIVVGSFDDDATRSASGQIVARTNVLPALLFWGR